MENVHSCPWKSTDNYKPNYKPGSALRGAILPEEWERGMHRRIWVVAGNFSNFNRKVGLWNSKHIERCEIAGIQGTSDVHRFLRVFASTDVLRLMI